MIRRCSMGNFLRRSMSGGWTRFGHFSAFALGGRCVGRSRPRRWSNRHPLK